MSLRDRYADTRMAVTRYRRRHGRWPNIFRPRTFNEKLVYKRLFDHRPYLTATADKYAVRQFVADRIGDRHLAYLYAVYGSADDINFRELPDTFVLKPTHGTGCVELVENATRHDLCALRVAAAGWLERRWPVWNRYIPPRLVVEEYLADADGGPPRDYRFFVMNGKVKMIAVDTPKLSGETIVRTLYSPSWERLNANYGRPAGPNLPQPASLDLMLGLADRLSDGTDFVRVDLYDLGDRVVFGELTHSPAAAGQQFDPPSFDLWLGKQWHQPRVYR